MAHDGKTGRHDKSESFTQVFLQSLRVGQISDR